jgi:hypothetical protein
MSPVAAVPSLKSQLARRIKKGQVTWPRVLIALFSRITLFAIYQALIALIFLARGTDSPWQESVAWWPLAVVFANLTSLLLLSRLAQFERLRLVDLYHADFSHWKRDLPVIIGLFLVLGPVGYFPMRIIATQLWGDSMVPVGMMFLPLPMLVVFSTMVLFPITNSLAELPTYFGYTSPRLEALSGNRWLAVGLAGFMLAAQHMTLPLILDGRFLLYRLGMFLPFAILTGVMLAWRPRLLPYAMIFHWLIDLMLYPFLLELAY